MTTATLKLDSIKGLRLEFGLTQETLAAAAQVARWKVQCAERGLNYLTSEEEARILHILSKVIAPAPPAPEAAGGQP